MNLSFSVTHDEMKAFAKALHNMQAKDVLVGFPAGDQKPRTDENGNPTPITNAVIAYTQNNGSPELNIPARPFMVEGVELKSDAIADGMENVGLAALDGDMQRVDMSLHAVGMIARDGIKQKIVDGPFAPLAESTLAARARRGGDIGTAAQKELDRREAGEAAGVEFARPLNESGQLRNAVNYALRDNPNAKH